MKVNNETAHNKGLPSCHLCFGDKKLLNLIL
jgi:hypothetical protein